VKVIGSLLILCLCSWASVEKVRPWKSFGFGRSFRYLSLLNFGAASHTKKLAIPARTTSILSYSALALQAHGSGSRKSSTYERRKLHIN
jgi:hypothetical protein